MSVSRMHSITLAVLCLCALGTVHLWRAYGAAIAFDLAMIAAPGCF